MTDNEKIPYIKCLYHTGKKVYKWWAIALLLIGVIIGLGLVVASAFGIIISLIGNAWSLACVVPWYWWVLFGVTVGPFILVAIWCALKHFDIEMGEFVIVILALASVFGVLNFFGNLLFAFREATPIDMIIGVFSLMWLVLVSITFNPTRQKLT